MGAVGPRTEFVGCGGVRSGGRPRAENAGGVAHRTTKAPDWSEEIAGAGRMGVAESNWDPAGHLVDRQYVHQNK